MAQTHSGKYLGWMVGGVKAAMGLRSFFKNAAREGEQRQVAIVKQALSDEYLEKHIGDKTKDFRADEPSIGVEAMRIVKGQGMGVISAHLGLTGAKLG
jgi:hypothetical protein